MSKSAANPYKGVGGWFLLEFKKKPQTGREDGEVVTCILSQKKERNVSGRGIREREEQTWHR